MEAPTGISFEKIREISLKLIREKDLVAARELWTNFMNHAMQHEDLRKAQEYAECCIAQLPDFYLGYLASGSIKQAEGDYEGALRDLSLASVLNSCCPSILTLKCNILKHLKRYPEALQNIEILINVDPKNTNHLRNGANILMIMGEYLQAITMLDKILEQQPGDPPALIDRAICLGMLKKYDPAMSIYAQTEKLVRKEWLSGPNMTWLALIHLNRGEARQKSGNMLFGKDEKNHGFALMELVNSNAFENRIN
jgi:tetratricopeptide (TPR) repeat protein